MNKLLILMFLFAVGSMLGWVIELFFRRYLDPVERKKKKWVNPGFLVGPCLPIYGFGLIVLHILSYISIPQMAETHPYIEKLVIFVIMALCMTLIEFLTGLIFIRRMHLQLWDYSTYPGNILGIICPLFSFFWYALAAFYYFVINPEVLDALDWLSRNLAFSYFIGYFYGILTLDLIYSFNVMVKIKRLADEYQVVIRYNAYKSKMEDLRREAKEKSRFFFTSRISSISMREVFEKHRDKFTMRGLVRVPIDKTLDKINEYRNKDREG